MICKMKTILLLISTLLWALSSGAGDDQYQIGAGIADITGPAAEINMVCHWVWDMQQI